MNKAEELLGLLDEVSPVAPDEQMISINATCQACGTAQDVVLILQDGKWVLSDPDAIYCDECNAEIDSLESYVTGVTIAVEPDPTTSEQLLDMMETGSVEVCYMTSGKMVCGPVADMLKKVTAGEIKRPKFVTGSFVPYTGATRGGKFPKVTIPPAVKDAQINTDKSAKLWAKGTWTVRGETETFSIYNPLYTAIRSNKKHSKVKKFVKNGLDTVVAKWRKEMNGKGDTAETAGLLLSAALTGQRIGSRSGTSAGVYKYVDGDKDQAKKKVMTKEVKTYALSTLLTDHVQIDGDTVTFGYTGKKAVTQKVTITDAGLAKFYKKLKAQGTGKPLHSDTAYGQAYQKLKDDTDGNFTLKDLRTALAHQLARKVRDQWVGKHGKPRTPGEKRDLVQFITQEVSKQLGNKPGESKRSYIDPALLT